MPLASLDIVQILIQYHYIWGPSILLIDLGRSGNIRAPKAERKGADHPISSPNSPGTCAHSNRHFPHVRNYTGFCINRQLSTKITCFLYGDMTPISSGVTPRLLWSSNARTYFTTSTASCGLKKDGLEPSLASSPSTPWKIIGKPLVGNSDHWQRLVTLNSSAEGTNSFE